MFRPDPARVSSTARGALWTGAIALLSLLAGCTVRNDPNFNPYARGGGDGTLMDRAEQAVEAGGQALDSLDARLENSVW